LRWEGEQCKKEAVQGDFFYKWLAAAAPTAAYLIFPPFFAGRLLLFFLSLAFSR
jgi:hypothetical protein